LATVVFTPLAPAFLLAIATSLELSTELGRRMSEQGPLVACLFALPAFVYALLCVALLVLTRRLPMGFPGRARLMGLAIAGLVFGVVGTGLSAVAPGLLASLPKALA